MNLLYHLGSNRWKSNGESVLAFHLVSETRRLHVMCMLHGKVSQLWKRQIQKTVKALSQPLLNQLTGLKWGFTSFLKITEAQDSPTC